MLAFSRGLKSIHSTLLNLVELGLGSRYIGPISGHISTHQLHSSHSQFTITTTELIKNYETYQNFQGERAVTPSGKWSDVTLIDPMHYKPQIFTDEVLQCVFDKYVITYQEI